MLREGARAHGLLNVRLKEFFSAQLFLPSPSEQGRIVDVMIAVDALIDALDAERRTATTLLALIRNAYPEGTEHPLSDVIAGIDSGKSVQTSDERPLPGEPAVLKLSAIQMGSFVASEAKRLADLAHHTDAHAVAEGDLLITRASGSFDRVGYATIARNVPPQTYMPDLIWRIRTKPDLCQSTFLAHLLCSPSVRAMITASARGTASMRKINKALLGSLRLPIPSLEEQFAYTARCDAVAFEAESLDSELTALRAFRSSLLTALLSQEIEIPELCDRLLEEVP
jgi:type I restriction enzyme S subunit